jgi:hypothetical protein
MERCPNCRARWDGAEHCRRCGLELAPLLAAEHAAHRLIVRALRHMGEGETQTALADLTRARELYREPFIDLLCGFARAEAWGETHLGEPSEVWTTQGSAQGAGQVEVG